MNITILTTVLALASAASAQDDPKPRPEKKECQKCKGDREVLEKELCKEGDFKKDCEEFLKKAKERERCQDGDKCNECNRRWEILQKDFVKGCNENKDRSVDGRKKIVEEFLKHRECRHGGGDCGECREGRKKKVEEVKRKCKNEEECKKKLEELEGGWKCHHPKKEDGKKGSDAPRKDGP